MTYLRFSVWKMEKTNNKRLNWTIVRSEYSNTYLIYAYKSIYVHIYMYVSTHERTCKILTNYINLE